VRPDRKTFRDMLCAFAPDELEGIVFFELNENPQMIFTRRDNLLEMALKLANWAESAGREEELLKIMIARKPGNQHIKAFMDAQRRNAEYANTQPAGLHAPEPVPHSPAMPEQAVGECEIVPLRERLPWQPGPPDVPVPPGYRYLGKLDNLFSHHLYRERDGHVMLFMPSSASEQGFLIDKYEITNQQFCLFINDLLSKKLAYIGYISPSGITCCNTASGQLLTLSAPEYWAQQIPEKIPTLPWGITYHNGRWEPVDGSALLPATMLTWLAAEMYGQWVRGKDEYDPFVESLPTVRQWRCAALYNPRTGREEVYPSREKMYKYQLNYAGRWAGQEIQSKEERLRFQKAEPATYKSIRPLQVGTMSDACSPAGCVHLLGNVWEWSADLAPDNPARRIIKGGDCTSPLEFCLPNHSASLPPNQFSPLIGFRCAFSI
jgi:formylglycine-generating enzyme required for sulfatase activity